MDPERKGLTENYGYVRLGLPNETREVTKTKGTSVCV
jgi:hypothetical protein